jgi:hypothetical protein
LEEVVTTSATELARRLPVQKGQRVAQALMTQWKLMPSCGKSRKDSEQHRSSAAAIASRNFDPSGGVESIPFVCSCV